MTININNYKLQIDEMTITINNYRIQIDNYSNNAPVDQSGLHDRIRELENAAENMRNELGEYSRNMQDA